MCGDFLSGLRGFWSWDYRTFLRNLLGRIWVNFEAPYLLFIILILAVFGAAARDIGDAVLGWPPLAGTCCSIACISLVSGFYGNASVERLFKWVSFFLYGVRGIRGALVLCIRRLELSQILRTPRPAMAGCSAD